jgi:broad specificity phosphatase PhoE
MVLAEAVAELSPKALYSSVEPKSTSTAEAIISKTGLAVGIDPDFNEQHRTNEPFVNSEVFGASVRDALQHPDALNYGTETVSAAVERFHRGVENGIRFAPPGDIAIVSHGTVIAGFIADVLNIPAVPVWEEMGLPGLLVINWPDPDGIELKRNFD